MTRSLARRPCPQVPQWHPRVAKRASIGTLARGPPTEALLWQGSVAKGRESVPLKGLRSSLRPGSARHLRLQVVLSHPRVAKRASIGTSARGLLPKVLQRHPSVAKRGFRPTLRHGDPQQTTSEMALRGEGTFSRIRIIKDYRTYFFNSNSGNLERKAICR